MDSAKIEMDSVEVEVDLTNEDYAKNVKTKGKIKAYVPPADVLELKVRTRQGKCVGAAVKRVTVTKKIPEMPQNPTIISTETWFHLANYIDPEDVLSYSLICKQSANSVNSRLFWLNMYRRYCQRQAGRSKKWVLCLPEELQLNRLGDCDRTLLKERVIRALYRCYPPFQKRLHASYPLKTLEGRIYVSSWRKMVNSKQLMCYKFQFKSALPSARITNTEDEEIDLSNASADNWESLADETNYNYCKEKQSCLSLSANSLQGFFLLLISSERFSPIPIMCNNDAALLRFANSRVLLSSDMKSEDLELKFVSTIDGRILTIKHLKVLEYKVIPWWHPCFEEYLKCD